MVNLKLLGTSLAEAGLMQKSFADMGEKEVLHVARLVDICSKKRCVHCDQWEKVPEAPWWIGTCRMDGHSLEKTSYCTITTDEPPF
ncbi:MAG: hypothetical protein RBR41_03215 [Desulfovibrio sp.]|uniref:hypothetical protein n=1 Tax=Desulfovibrio sp. TaxID=885 RepID=UPI002A35D568|nr:hypothetical protein [Desulfovibrio sp.]MDY0258661.1 hypothetical protein [Desulfovibrio sp.]